MTPTEPPRIRLLSAPTRLHRIADVAPLPVWIKRDDENSTVFGGAKTRALEYTLGAALAAGATTVLTTGTEGSNHVAATAAHAAHCGLLVTALVLPQSPGPLVTRNTRITAAAGARVEHVASGVSVHPARMRHRAALDGLIASGERPHVIAFGGADPVAGIAHAAAGRELGAQCRAQGLAEPVRVYLPSASTLTAAGIAAGLVSAGVAAQVNAVDVVGDPSVTGDGILARARAVAGALGADPGRVTPGHVRHVPALDDVPYGVPGAAATDAAALLRARVGLWLDETYLAKAFARFLADVSALADVAEADRGTPVFWYTGDSRPT